MSSPTKSRRKPPKRTTTQKKRATPSSARSKKTSAAKAKPKGSAAKARASNSSNASRRRSKSSSSKTKISTSAYFQPPKSGSSKRNGPGRGKNSSTSSKSKLSTKKQFKSLPVTEIGERRAAFLTILITGLTLFGLVTLLSASSVESQHGNGDSLFLFRRQAIWAAVGAVGFVVCSRIDYRLLRRIVPLLLGLSILLLTLVLIPGFGIRANGASRWLSLGPVAIQPAEIAKFSLVVFVAHILALRERRMDRSELTVRPVMVILSIMAGLLALQPKLGTILVIGFTVVVMLFVAGAPLRHLMPWFLGGILAMSILVITSSNAMGRIDSFLNPSENAQGSAYQLDQSQISVASGGVTGVGLGAGRAKWGYLPEVESDFIFASLAEEVGLIGASAVICAFLLVGWFSLRAALEAPDRFGMLLTVGFCCWILCQAFLNIAVVLGIFPTTGVPLPFISAGGSSLVMVLAASGLVTNVARRAKS